ncbi:baseplate J/gp47 family protein [Couchioplanes caeruleus]|uniref:Phage baseplate assembly protein n=2 Tax=Couchioplanes caeruleus TaxID=56438 RepID=A0A1K0GAD0_9ACTN|nr:hypothetical protein [Couchioplanes caeruleus]OJF14194.1 hypothetical protein BG844_11085 [Couchioplanes caeruleus subsp. caeruleus]ROP28319.1 putative phage baseplate assembly protein [Couchioplanes caeruleus]
MSDFVPDLDTVAFDQMVERARADIPRYAPGWTDHNLHDPGMTLIDLLAWIVDQQIYRAGFVGGRYRRAFAALLGRNPTGPAPARGLIWPDRPPPDGRRVPARTALLCLTHRELAFSLDHDELYLPPVTLSGVVRADGAGIALDGGSWMAGNGFTLAFDGPLGADADETPVVLGFDVVAPPGLPVDPPWGPVTYAYRASGSGWREVCVVRDSTAGLTATGVVVLSIPRMPAGPGGSELRLSFDRGFFPLTPQIRAVAVNVLPVVQLGHEQAAAFPENATGLPDQLVEFDTTDLARLPEITVGADTWAQRADLTRSGPTDRHYLVRPDGIQFGNGVNGRRPPTGAVISHGELSRTEATKGNLRSGLRWTVPVLNLSSYGHNRHALVGGQDPGGDLTAVARDAAVQRSALLSDAELVEAALALPGLAVRRAEALAGFDPRLPNRRVDAVRTLVIVPPRSAGARDYPAVVASRLEPRRVLGERLIVEEPTVVAVDLQLTLTIEPGALEAPSTVEARLRDRLSMGVRPLGRELTAADVMTIAAVVPGVTDVPAVRMAKAGEPFGAGPIVVPRDALIVAGRIDFTGGRSTR